MQAVCLLMQSPTGGLSARLSNGATYGAHVSALHRLLPVAQPQGLEDALVCVAHPGKAALERDEERADRLSHASQRRRMCRPLRSK